MVHQKGHPEAQDDARSAAHKADESGLNEEHIADISHVAAKNLHDADFLCPLIDRHHHGVGNADGRHKEGDRADAAQDCLHHVRLLAGALQPIHLAAHLPSHVRQALLHLLHILHVVHVNLGAGIGQIAQGLPPLVGGLARNGRALAESPGELALHAVNVHIHIVGIVVPGVDIPLHHADCVHHILLWWLYRLSSIFPGHTGGRAGLALIIGVHVKYHKEGLSHEIHIRKLHGIPVALAGLGVGELLNHRISYHQSSLTGLWKPPLPQGNLLQIGLSHAPQGQVLGLVDPLAHNHIDIQHRRDAFHMLHTGKLLDSLVRDILRLGASTGGAAHRDSHAPVSHVGADFNGRQASVGLNLLHSHLIQTDSKGNHDHNGGRADDDAQHGQDGPQLPPPQIIYAHE